MDKKKWSCACCGLAEEMNVPGVGIIPTAILLALEAALVLFHMAHLRRELLANPRIKGKGWIVASSGFRYAPAIYTNYTPSTSEMTPRVERKRKSGAYTSLAFY